MSSDIEYLGIFFDMDGTLVDSLTDINRSVNAVRQDFKLEPVPEKEVASHIGNGLEHMLLHCLPEIVTHHNLAQLVDRYRDHYVQGPHEAKLYPHVKETLQSLRALPSIKLGVVTNRSTKFAKKVLGDFFPQMMFDVVVGSDVVTAPKPHASHLQEALKRLELKAQKCWYIGDHMVDYECAKNAGVSFIGVSYGYGVPGKDTSSHVSDLSQIIDRLPIERGEQTADLPAENTDPGNV